jgi:hypothetical protein
VIDKTLFERALGVHLICREVGLPNCAQREENAGEKSKLDNQNAEIDKEKDNNRL